VSRPRNDDRPALLGGAPIRPAGPPIWPPTDEAVIEAIHRAATAGAWGKYSGPHSDELRTILQAIHGVRHVWLCSSGTAAVELALRGLGVAAGDEVILAAYDFKANFTDVLAVGALPVLVDLQRDDWHLDVARVPQAITPRTKAIIVSHLHGGSVCISQLREAVGGRIPILEDACQCPGATIDGRPAGSSGDIGVLSFGGSKLTAAGRGGAVLTNRPELIERIKRHVLRGNDLAPLSELQAAALVPQWRSLAERNQRRRENVTRLSRQISEFCCLRLLTPPESCRASGYYKVGFEYVPSELCGLSRDVLCLALRAEGIACWPGFRSLHRIHASRRYRAAAPLDVADRADEQMVVLHHPVLLGSDEEIDEISLALRKMSRFAEELASGCFEIPPAPWELDE